MSRLFLRTASLTLCWALSPDVLVLLGNSFGQYGKAFAIALMAGAVLSAAAAYLIHHPTPAPVREDRRAVIGAEAFTTITVSLAGRLSPTLLLSTGMLVTAGFTFNETFVYWFPNFGFSFLLLLLVVILHLCGEKVILAAQQVFFVLTSSCLLFLAVAGLLTGPVPLQPTVPTEPAVPAVFLALVPLAMLFFLGYDQHMPGEGDGNYRYFPAAVGLGFLLLALWGLASLSHVPQARLAESSVPYVVAAKAILGQPGRLIMGIAVISGTCCAVSGLFYLAIRTVRQILAESAAQDSTRQHHSWLPKMQAILMAFLIALFLALGLAGSENLEVFTFGALLLWLLTIGTNCLAITVHLHKRDEKKYSPLGYAMGVLILAAVAYLAFTYPQPRLLVGFCVPVLVASGLFSAIWCRFGRKRNPAINNTKGDIL